MKDPNSVKMRANAELPIEEGLSISELFDVLQNNNKTLTTGEIKSILQDIGSYRSVRQVDIDIMLFRDFSDANNALRFKEFVKDEFLYVHGQNWFFWNGFKWQPDTKMRRVSKVVSLADLLQKLHMKRHTVDQESANAILKRIRGLKNKKKIDDMLCLAKPLMSFDMDSFNKNKMLFNTAAGTVNLRTGKLQKHDKLDYITQMSPIFYDQEAKAPLWDKFLLEIFNGNKEVIKYIQKAIGYSITGSMCEQVFFVCYGNGCNGKSVLLNMIKYILGDYAATAEFRTFVEKKNDSIRGDLADLVNTRMVISSESDTNESLAEGIIKQITGGDAIRVRKLYKDFFEYHPTFKLWFSSNYKPNISMTKAVRRRIRMIPFEVTIPDAQVDKNLTSKLKNEAAGILNWIIEGSVEWQKNGLKEPAEITTFTNKLFKTCNKKKQKQQVDMSKFIEAWCDIGGKKWVGNEELRLIFKRWANYHCDGQMVSKNDCNMLFKELKRLGCKPEPRHKGRGLLGLRLKKEDHDKVFSR